MKEKKGPSKTDLFFSIVMPSFTLMTLFFVIIFSNFYTANQGITGDVITNSSYKPLFLIGIIILVILILLIFSIYYIKRGKNPETEISDENYTPEIMAQARAAVRDAKSGGYTPFEIRKQFLDNGWSNEKIDKIMND